MIKMLVTLTVIIVIAAGTTWYFAGMPSFGNVTTAGGPASGSQVPDNGR